MILADLVEKIGRDLSIYPRKAVRRVLRNPRDKMAAHSRVRHQRNCSSQLSFLYELNCKGQSNYGAVKSAAKLAIEIVGWPRYWWIWWRKSREIFSTSNRQGVQSTLPIS